MINVLRHEHERHPVRSYLIRTSKKLIIVLILLGALFWLSSCACKDAGVCPYKMFPNSNEF